MSTRGSRHSKSLCGSGVAFLVRRGPLGNFLPWQQGVKHINLLGEPQTHPKLHSPVWVGSKSGRPQRGYKFARVCSCMAGHYPGSLMTGHIGTNTPKFVAPRWGLSAPHRCVCDGHPALPVATSLRWLWLLVNFLLFCTVNHCGERKNGSKGGKARCAM